MGFSITLQPDNHTFTAEAGETILDAAKEQLKGVSFELVSQGFGN